jgi:hypothetical protein
VPRRAVRKGPAVANLVPTVVIAVLVLLAAPLWPWSRGWTWAPAGILLMGLATLLLFSWAVVPE